MLLKNKAPSINKTNNQIDVQNTLEIPPPISQKPNRCQSKSSLKADVKSNVKSKIDNESDKNRVKGDSCHRLDTNRSFMPFCDDISTEVETGFDLLTEPCTRDNQVNEGGLGCDLKSDSSGAATVPVTMDMVANDNPPEGYVGRNGKKGSRNVSLGRKSGGVTESKWMDIESGNETPTGVEISCNSCHKTRLLQDIIDINDLPSVWTCDMAKNDKFICKIAQENIKEEFVNMSYKLGSIVWARVPGFCWWPAIIDKDPNTKEFYSCHEKSEDVSHYHVTFLDEDVSRSWVHNKDIKFFRSKKDMDSLKFGKNKKNYLKLITKAVERAEECLKLSLQECLDKYSFAVRYTGKPNLWTKGGKVSLKRKSKSSNSDTSHDANETKENLEEINMETSLIEAKCDVLMTVMEQSKHKRLHINQSKNNNVNTKSKRRKKIKKSDKA